MAKAKKRVAKAKKPLGGPLDAINENDPLYVISLMLWQDRFREPDMYRQIELRDIEGLKACVGYQKVKPTVKIYRPGGQAAQTAMLASGKRKAVPARQATAPKPYVIVTLVDERTGDVIRPIEDNESDYGKSQDASKIHRAREQAPEMAQRLNLIAKTGEYYTSDLSDIANALLLLSRA